MPPDRDVDVLTARQLECLRLLWQRLSIKEIAARLNISVPAVKQHLAAARERLGNLPTSLAAARLVAEREDLSNYTSGISPPSRVVPDKEQPPDRGAAPADREPILDEQQAFRLYRAERIGPLLPVPTSARPVNDLTWRGKLLWGLVIAFVAVALIGSFKVLLD